MRVDIRHSSFTNLEEKLPAYKTLKPSWIIRVLTGVTSRSNLRAKALPKIRSPLEREVFVIKDKFVNITSH